MRIAVVAHLRHPIAPPFMGGMEAHCHGLVTALIARGHDVTLFASGTSDPALPVSAIAPTHYEAVLPWALWRDTPDLTHFQEQAFGRAWRRIVGGGYDVVHNNTMHPSLHRWARREGQAMVTSLHVPPFKGLAEPIAATAAPWLRLTTTSRAHQATWWRHPPEGASVVHNGIDLANWPFQPEGNGSAIWCGRVTPTKGTAVAIRAARQAGIALDIVGPIDCQTYFDEEVAPLLDDGRRYIGPLAHDVLAAVMARSSVLVATPMWDEPFGLVAIEAMACGVPVAALDRGALGEVVGEAGCLAATADTLPAAILAAQSIDRAACRARVGRLFTVERMIDGYERAYAAAIAGLSDSSKASTRALLA